MKDVKNLLNELYTELFNYYKKNNSGSHMSDRASSIIQYILKTINHSAKVNEDQGNFLIHLIRCHLHNPEVCNPNRRCTDQSDLYKAISIATWINSCHE